MAVLHRRAAIALERLELGGNRREDLRIAITLLGRVLHGIFPSGTHDVDLRMRLLIRQRKRIEIFVVVELAVEARWARLGPGLHQDVHAFAKKLTGVGWVERRDAGVDSR